MSSSGSSPSAGFRPTVPQAAGGNADGPAGVGADRRERHAGGDAAADPPLDPPGDRDGSCGLWAGPNAESSLVVPNANSCRLHLPMKTTPASRSCAAAGASRSARCPSRTREAAVVGVPRRSIRSLREIGMPCSGPRYRPAAISRSAPAPGQRLVPEDQDERVQRGVARPRCAPGTPRRPARRSVSPARRRRPSSTMVMRASPRWPVRRAGASWRSSAAGSASRRSLYSAIGFVSAAFRAGADEAGHDFAVPQDVVGDEQAAGPQQLTRRSSIGCTAPCRRPERRGRTARRPWPPAATRRRP